METPAGGVVDRRSEPTGALPKKVLTLAVVGLMAVVVLVVALAARGQEARIAEHAQAMGGRRAVESDILHRISAQESVDRDGREARAAQDRPARASRAPRGAARGYAGGPSPEANEDRARAYRSRFSSSIALSYRADRRRAGPPEMEGAVFPQLAGRPPALPPIDGELAALLAGLGGAKEGAPAAAGEAGGAARGQRPDTTEHNRASGPRYLVPEGTVIEAVLLTRLAGEHPGEVKCLTTADVYSNDLGRVLIPSGSTFLGEAKAVQAVGQQRLAIAFHRLLMPDLYSVDLDDDPGLDQAGETAMHDKVNNHFFRIFGTAAAVGAIGGLANIGGAHDGGFGGYRAGVGASTAQSATQVLDRYTSILPTLTIREGHRMRVFLTQDLALPDYEAHAMPPDGAVPSRKKPARTGWWDQPKEEKNR